MVLDVSSELSVEKLISMLNKKLLMEPTSIQSTVPFASPTSFATVTAKVRSGELKTTPRAFTQCF